MISGRDFLVLSDDWNGLPNSAKHLFRHVLPGNRVFWWNVITRLPRLSRSDAGKVIRVLGQWGKQLVGAGRRASAEQGDSPGAPHTATPWMIPWFKPLVRRLNRASLARRFERLAREHHIRNPIVLTTFPSTVDFVRFVPAAAKVYYCVDEWLHYPGLNPADWQVMENELIEHVDGVVATSRDLEKKGRRCRASLYLPHGVDFEHFQAVSQQGPPVPALEKLARPIVGFFGLIAPWVDLRVVAALGRAFPKLSFVLIGKAVVGMQELSKLPNVHFLGMIPYEQLPAYARYFNVGLIPFARNELTEAVNPLKLLEYYALGLPVVGTRLRELEGLAGPLYLASDEAEFCAQVERALGNASGDREAALAVARQNTWRQRAEELSLFIANLL